ncbi:MAG: cbb3-type cytochrome c oxidase subunit I [Verrucomicrobiota bacterium]
MKQSHSTHNLEILPLNDKISSENYFLNSFLGSHFLFWLLFSTLFLLVESIKLHAPETFNDHSWSNYGRIHHAAQLCLFGAITEGLLWIGFSQIVSAGQYLERYKTIIKISICFINLAILIGIIEILSGNTEHGTSIFPLFSLLLFSFGILLLTPLLWKTLLRIESLTPSLLFSSLSFWILPLSLTTIVTLSLNGFLKGAYGAWMLSWFSHHFTSLFLFPLGISAFLDYIQQATQKPLRDPRSLRIAFWTYTFSNFLISSDLTGSPLTFIPAWLRALDTVGSVFSSFSIFIILRSVYLHVKPSFATLKCEISFAFFSFSALSLILLTILKAVLSFQTIDQWVQFTSLSNALQTLFLFGFLIMILFAWIYNQSPIQLHRVWASPSLIQTHFWLASLSTGLTALGFFSAGAIQTYQNTVLDIPFLDTVILIKPFLWIQSLSLVFQFSGTLMISLLFTLLLFNWKPDPKTSMFANPTAS